MSKHSLTGGYTLVELMVSVGLFAVVMTLAAGAYLTMLNLNNSAQGVSTSIDSVSFTLEYLSREIRTGSAYGCPTTGVDCAYPNGGSTFTVKDQNLTVVTFSRKQISGSANYGVYQTIGGVSTLLTDPSINITRLTFYAAGTKPYSSTPVDISPAHVTILVAGTVSTGKQSFPFTVETGATMRNIDL